MPLAQTSVTYSLNTKESNLLGILNENVQYKKPKK
jgi:hypothetical protein